MYVGMFFHLHEETQREANPGPQDGSLHEVPTRTSNASDRWRRIAWWGGAIAPVPARLVAAE